MYGFIIKNTKEFDDVSYYIFTVISCKINVLSSVLQVVSLACNVHFCCSVVKVISYAVLLDFIQVGSL